MVTAAPPYRFVLVGFGRIGKRHSAVLHEHPLAQLVALVDRDTARQDDPDYPRGVPFFEDLEQFLQSPIQADVAIIATPNGWHCRQGIRALQQQMHVIIEKPMGVKSSDCEDLIKASRQAQRQVYVVKQNRYSPPARWLKELVDGGALGRIYQLQINCFWNREAAYYRNSDWKGTAEWDGGILFTQFSHFIDILYWVFGDIEHINTRLANFAHSDSTEFADSGVCFFDLVRGGLGSIQFSTTAWQQNMESSLSLLAENGSLKIGGQYMNEVRYCRIKDYERPKLAPAAQANQYEGYQGSAAHHYAMLDNVIKSLQSKTSHTVNAQEGMKVVDIIERIYAAAR